MSISSPPSVVVDRIVDVIVTLHPTSSHLSLLIPSFPRESHEETGHRLSRDPERSQEVKESAEKATDILAPLEVLNQRKIAWAILEKSTAQPMRVKGGRKGGSRP